MTINLSLKNVPDELHKRLQVSAERHRRSMNSEILDMLDTATRSATHRDALLEDLDAFRSALSGRRFDHEDIRSAIEDGRE